ncbi:MAG TPA: 4-aminobutyrate--2-oxoglutarate transaminase [Calditrichae bacterium]|nr:4-aminobutyrate--2-oxoglutarate transaminase [Calditrichia bacterium]
MKYSERTTRLLERRQAVVPRAPFHVTPLFVERAKGALVWDTDGNQYIDFAGGIGTLNAGHCPDEVVQAIREQSGKYLHTCFNVMMYEPYIELAEKLVSLMPGKFDKKAMFFNSGAEAVENAIKIARKATGRPAVIAFDHAFHGRTLLTMTLTAKENPYKAGFGPFAPEVYRAAYPYPYRMPDVFSNPDDPNTYVTYFERFFQEVVPAERVAAIIVEPQLGEGGFIAPPPAFLPALRQITEQHGIVFIADEIQTGFCRTGEMFAVTHYGVEPDLLVLGKSLASGMPLSAVVGKSELMEAPQVGGLGGTYAGNPVACAAAIATLDVYEKYQLCERARTIGERVRSFWLQLQQQYPVIGDVRGLGAMIGVEFVSDPESREPNPKLAKAIVESSYKKGLITMTAGTYGNVLRHLMPLVITDEQLETGLSILETVMKEISP